METVYVVDPDAGIRDSIQIYLESFNVPVQTFPDTQTFLHAGGEAVTGCVVTESELPDINGLGLLKYLRNQGNDIPVILLVGTATFEFTQRALRAGAIGVLEKPHLDDDMVTHLQRILGVGYRGLYEVNGEPETLRGTRCD